MPDDPAPPTATPAEPHGVPKGRVMHVVYVCALAATVMGLYFGMRYRPAPPPTDYGPRVTPAATPPAHAPGVRPSLAYRDITPGSLGPNAAWRSQLPDPAGAPDAWAHGVAPAPGDVERLRAARAQRRAYDGAPPTIPHRITPTDVASCTACHGEAGLRVGAVVAPAMPHAHYASCTQCHVPQHPVEPGEQAWLDNHFVGRASTGPGHRAWEGAPPTIPHNTAMRSNCMACHGPAGKQALRSTHPWRASCTQCHAPSAGLNRQPGAAADTPFFLPPPAAAGE